MVFMLAAVHDLLKAKINVPIYMRQPKGYEKGDLVSKLSKAFYGTKQTG
jgi:hypothetical protein